MRRSARGLVLMMALGLSVGVAAAEPIRFGYSTTGAGSYEYPYTYSMSGGREGVDAVRMSLTPFAEREWDTSGEREYDDRHTDTIRLGTWFRPFGRGDWSAGADITFRHEAKSPLIPVTMTVRDFVSGETADIPLSYMLYYSDSYGDHLYLGASESGLLGRATLGEHVYEFRADWEDDNAMYVTVTTAVQVVGTPEPATLLLAGLGLAVVAARRVGRRGRNSA